MKLTYSQKRYIQKHYPQETVEGIAKTIHTPIDIIQKHISDNQILFKKPKEQTEPIKKINLIEHIPYLVLLAMFIILDYIWTRIKTDQKKRLLIVDEAWHMMKYQDSAQFLWSIVKRARKYYLGLTTITQDVEDFLAQDIGKAIVTNSAMRLLLKQSPAAIDKIGETFYLSQGEKQLLLAANIGEGIFFAGPHHAPIRVVASPEEYTLVTTNPKDRPIKNAQINQNQQTSDYSPADITGMANVTNTGTAKI